MLALAASSDHRSLAFSISAVCRFWLSVNTTPAYLAPSGSLWAFSSEHFHPRCHPVPRAAYRHWADGAHASVSRPVLARIGTATLAISYACVAPKVPERQYILTLYTETYSAATYLANNGYYVGGLPIRYHPVSQPLPATTVPTPIIYSADGCCSSRNFTRAKPPSALPRR